MFDSGSIEIFIIQVTMLLVITEDVIIFIFDDANMIYSKEVLNCSKKCT